MKAKLGRTLTHAEALAIRLELERHEFRAGEFRENLARRFGCGRPAVDMIAQGKTWVGISARAKEGA